MAKTRKTEMKTPAASKPEKDLGIDSDRPGNPVGPPADEIDRLGTMKIGELQTLLAELTGEKTRSPNRAWLIKMVIEAAVPMASEDDPAATGAPDDGGVEHEDLATDAGSADGQTARRETGEVGLATAAREPEGGLSIEPGTHVAEPGRAANAGHLAADSTASPAQVDPAGAVSPALPNLSKLDVPALQARYFEVIGRATTSTSRNYLINRLREAQKDRAPSSPRQRHQKAGDAVMVLPLRMEADLVDKLDATWRRLGLRNRMDLFRRSLSSYLASVGENDVAALLATEA